MTDQVTHSAENTIKPEDIHLPPNSYWPVVLALGFCLIMAGLALNIAIATTGIVITLVAVIGWVIEPVHSEEH
jgi:uncharacterized membrane protein HdeD (DUF308 family)